MRYRTHVLRLPSYGTQIAVCLASAGCCACKTEGKKPFIPDHDSCENQQTLARPTEAILGGSCVPYQSGLSLYIVLPYGSNASYICVPFEALLRSPLLSFAMYRSLYMTVSFRQSPCTRWRGLQGILRLFLFFLGLPHWLY